MSDMINGTTQEEYSQVFEYFEQWLKLLKQSLEFLQRKSENNQLDHEEMKSMSMDLMDPLDLVKRLSTEHLSSSLVIPQWITTLQENNLGTKEKLMKVILTANELRSRLIRIKLPTVMGQIDRLQNDYLELISKASTGIELTESNVVSQGSLTLSHSDHLNMVLHYLSGINDTRKDEVVQLCCLADANSRLSITNTTDIAYIDNWIGEGKTALESSLKKLEFLNQRQSSLEELTTTTESYNTSPSDIARTNKVNASQLSQMVLPSVLHRGNTLNLPFPQVLNASNPPLLSTTNDQENCLSILQREFDQQSSQLRHLIEREREAKKAWEEAQAALSAASGSISCIKTALEATVQRQQLLTEVTQKRIEVERYNIESSRIMAKIFEDLKQYLQNIKQRVEQGDVKHDLPLMFSQIIDSFCSRWLKISPNQGFPHSQQTSKHPIVKFDGSNEGIQGMNVIMSDSSKELDDPLNGVNQLSSLARIGLEMTRLWKQLNEVDTDEMWRAIMQFEALIHTRILSVVKTPSPMDKDSSHIPRFTDTTVVLYYDHLSHITPKNHFECAMRTTVSLKALQEQQSKVFYYSYDLRCDDEDGAKKPQKRSRKLEFLSCNQVVSPPLWALPLTHSSSYLQTLCRVAGKAEELNAIIPLDMSYDYEYLDDLASETASSDSNPERLPSKAKLDLDFSLSPDLDGILGDKKARLMSLLKADQDDLLVIQALKKTPTPTSNGVTSTMRTRGQAQSRNQGQVDPQIQETPQQVTLESSEPKAVELPKYQPSELLQLVADWENGIISDEEIDQHIVDVMAYLVRMVGSQKPIAKAMNVTPQTFSAWLARRTSAASFKAVANSSRELLKENTLEELYERLRPLNRSRTPVSSRGDESKDSVDEIKIDISTKSMDVVDSNIESSHHDHDEPHTHNPPSFQYAMYSLTNQDGYRGVTSKRPSRATKKSESLRHIVQALGRREHISDDDIARELSQKFEPMKAVMISNWRSYRLPAPGDAKLNFYLMLWIQDHRHQLTDSENLLLKTLEDYVAILSNQGDVEIKSESPLDPNNDIFEDILKDPEIQDLDITSPLKSYEAMEHEVGSEHQTLNRSIELPESEYLSNDPKMAVVDDDGTEDASCRSDPVKDEVAESDSSFLPLSVLRQQVIDELNRRGIRQNTASAEANLSIIGLGQPAVSLLLHKAECKSGEKGLTFRRLMQDWLNNSRLLPSETKSPHDGKHQVSKSHSELPEDHDELQSSGPESDEDVEDMAGDDQSLIPLTRLHTMVTREMQSRGIKQKDVLLEANVDKSSLSNFITGYKCANSQKGYAFRRKLEKWLKESHEKYGTGADQDDIREEEVVIEVRKSGISRDSYVEMKALQNAMKAEIRRRGVKRDEILKEAGILGHGFKQSLARLLLEGVCVASTRGSYFRDKMDIWLKNSVTKSPSPETLHSLQQKILKIRSDLLGHNITFPIVIVYLEEFSRLSLSHQDAFDAIKFDNAVTNDQFSSYLTAEGIDEVRNLFDNLDVCYSFITSIQSWARDNFTVEEESERPEGSMIDSPNKSTKRKRAAIPQSLLDLDSEDDIESDLKRSKPAAATFEVDTEKKVKSSGIDTFRGKPLVRADIFREGFHHLRCECCSFKVQDGSELLNCIACPYSYHPDCASPPALLSTPNWCCETCRGSGVIGSQEFTAANGEALIAQSPWILVWSTSHKRWRPGFVQEIDQVTGYILLRWWRNDSKWGRENWVDLADGKACWSATGINPHVKPKAKSRMSIERRSLEASTQRTNRLRGLVSPRPVTPFDDNTLNFSSIEEESSKSEPVTIQPELVSSVNLEMSTIDTFISADSLKAAICAAGSACRAVDIVMCGTNTNVFCCMRPPGHHVGRRGFTEKCQGTGFCLLNNAAIAMLYARVRWGLKRVAVVDIDVHFGNGTSEILKGDPRAFFGCVHMIHGEENEGFSENQFKCCPGLSPKDSLGDRFQHGFFPHALGCTQVSENYISVGVYPETARNLDSLNATTHRFGASGFRSAITDVIIPNMERFDPELLIISAGFDGNKSDPLGGDFGLSAGDYSWATHALLSAISRPQSSGRGRVISLLEGGYDIRRETQGLASSVDEHVRALRKHPPVSS